MKIEYLEWVKNLYRSFSSLPAGALCHNLTASCVSAPLDLMAAHIAHGLSRSHLEPPDPWFNMHLTNEIADIQETGTDSILLTIGASQAISLVCMALLEKGDQVIIEDPCYQPLLAVPQYLGALIKKLHRNPDNEFGVDPEQLDRLMTDDTKLIILTNLHNPSGAVMPVDELKQLYAVAKKHNPNVKILIDEVYLRFVNTHPPSAATLGEGFIAINSLSKVYGLWVLRCGWITAHPAIIEKVKSLFVLLENVGAPMNESVSSIVFEHLDAYGAESDRIVSRNREIIHENLDPLFENGIMRGKIPEHGPILFPGFQGVEDADNLVQYLSSEHGVYVVPGRFFDMPGRVRMGFGGETESFKKAIQAFSIGIRQYLDQSK